MHKLLSSKSASTNPIQLINQINSPLHTQQDIINAKINRKELIDTLLKTIKKKSNQNEKPKKRIRSNANSGQKLDEINQNVLHIQDYYTKLFQLKKVISKIILPKTQQLSNYNMLQFIGRGKYSEVNQHVKLLLEYMLHLKQQQIQSIWKSIAQELKIQYLLNHPNNVKLYTFFQTKIQNQKTYFYDMIELNQLISLILSILQNKKDLHNVVLQVTFPLKLLRERIMIKVQICGLWVYQHMNYVVVKLLGKIYLIWKCKKSFKVETQDFHLNSLQNQKISLKILY